MLALRTIRIGAFASSATGKRTLMGQTQRTLGSCRASFQCSELKYPTDGIGQLFRVRADCRPLLLAEVGGSVHSAGQTTLYLTPMHGKATLLKPFIANIHAALQHGKAAAEQFKSADRWAMLLRYVSDKIAPALGPFRVPTGLPATG